MHVWIKFHARELARLVSSQSSKAVMHANQAFEKVYGLGRIILCEIENESCSVSNAGVVVSMQHISLNLPLV